jgi:Glycosyl hydrolases family 39
MKRGLILSLTIFLLMQSCSTISVTPTPALAQILTSSPSPFPSATITPSPVPNTLYVDPGTDLGPISPYLFGSNYGPWVAIPFDMIQSAFNSDITILRFPAGSWGDQNNLQPFSIDTFMGILNKINASAMINVRLENGTPQQAAQLVQYVNIGKKYNVRYWAIGNEPSLYAADSKSDYDTVQFNKDWRAFALAMKAVDPSIQLIGPEIHQFTDQPDQNPKDSSGRDWMTEFLKANGDLVDIVSFHRYPFPQSNTSLATTIDQLHQNLYQWDHIIIYLRNLIHQTTGRDLPIAVTEFNSDYTKVAGEEASPDSYYNAIWTADVLGRLMRNKVFMADQWMLTSESGDADGWGLIGDGELRPSYYVYQMYHKFGNELIYSSSSNSDLSIYAAKRADGSITTMVINLSLNVETQSLRIEKESAQQAETWLFDPSHPVTDMGATDLSAPINFPPQSITLYIVQP